MALPERPGTLAVHLLLTCSLLACGGGGGPDDLESVRPDSDLGVRDVMLITVDALRFDATGFSGAGRGETPVMDSLAASGIVFERAHAHAVMTLPSHASILTGLYPYQHGVHDDAGFVLSGAIPTIASVLEQRDFATAAFVSAFPLDHRFGLGRGFDVYDDDYTGGQASETTISVRSDRQTVARAKAWWEANEARRRFVWVHLFGPHLPYEPDEPFATEYSDARYFGEVAAVDAALRPLIGPLVEQREASTLVVLTSDHGEALGEHGERGHGLFAYESTLRVPLVFRAPRVLIPATNRIGARHVDLMPTVLDLLGVEVPGGLPGRALFSSASGEVDGGTHFEALSGFLRRGSAPLRGRIEGRLKAIRQPSPELYDLGLDPEELRNLAGELPPVLNDVLSRIPTQGEAPAGDALPDQEVVERLRAVCAGIGREDGR